LSKSNFLQQSLFKRKKVPKLKEKGFFSIAWHKDHLRKALDWWIQTLKEPKEKQLILG